MRDNQFLTSLLTLGRSTPRRNIHKPTQPNTYKPMKDTPLTIKTLLLAVLFALGCALTYAQYYSCGTDIGCSSQPGCIPLPASWTVLGVGHVEGYPDEWEIGTEKCGIKRIIGLPLIPCGNPQNFGPC